MEKQLLTLREAYIGLQANLENTQQELVQAQQSVAPLVQAAAIAEESRQAGSLGGCPTLRALLGY